MRVFKAMGASKLELPYKLRLIHENAYLLFINV